MFNKTQVLYKDLARKSVFLRRYPTLYSKKMNSKLTISLAIAMLCCVTGMLCAQDSGLVKNKLAQLELGKGLRFLSDGVQPLTDRDIQIINQYNFEAYRKENTRTKIQLVKGPLLELLSKKEVTQLENPNQGNLKHEATKTNKTYDLIIQLNIGLGYSQPKQLKELGN